MVSLYDAIGLIGVFLSIYSYARLQWHRDYAKKMGYSVLNLVSAIFLCVSLVKNWNLASFICNGIWGIISAYGVYRCCKYLWREKMSVKTQP